MSLNVIAHRKVVLCCIIVCYSQNVHMGMGMGKQASPSRSSGAVPRSHGPSPFPYFKG
jgi:hypothetical protein